MSWLERKECRTYRIRGVGRRAHMTEEAHRIMEDQIDSENGRGAVLDCRSSPNRTMSQEISLSAVEMTSMLETTTRIILKAVQDKLRLSVPFDLAGHAASSVWPPQSAYWTEWITHGKFCFGSAAIRAVRRRNHDIYPMSAYESMLVWETVTKSPVPGLLLALTSAEAQIPFDGSQTFLIMCCHRAQRSLVDLNEWVSEELGELLYSVFLHAHEVQNARFSGLFNVPLPELFREMEKNWPESLDQETQPDESAGEGVRLVRSLPRRLQKTIDSNEC
ncbi:hypothetical protein FB451DRAFT_1176060 [Mycena latifolia]|nr:hypothetical protein FB451DRAFT_1176060 [Mycena latifolia]